MNQAIGNALIFIGAVVLFLSAISIVYPIRAIGFASRKRAFWILIGSIAVAIAGGALVSPEKPKYVEQAPTSAPAAPVSTQDTPGVLSTQAPAPAPVAEANSLQATQASALDPTPTPSAPPMPDDQRVVVEAIASAQQAARSASNDMQKGAALAGRNQALCKVLKGLKVTNWVGEINKVGANGDGKGVLYVQIAPDAYVETWNNSLSDAFDKTLIEPGSSVFTAASQLAEGQSVVFSGSFVPASSTDGGECVKESSMTLDGKIKEPEFIFRFTAIGAQ